MAIIGHGKFYHRFRAEGIGIGVEFQFLFAILFIYIGSHTAAIGTGAYKS